MNAEQFFKMHFSFLTRWARPKFCRDFTVRFSFRWSRSHHHLHLPHPSAHVRQVNAQPPCPFVEDGLLL